MLLQHPQTSNASKFQFNVIFYVISNNTYLAWKFLYGFIHQKPRYALSQNFWKICEYSALQQAMPAKFISMLYFNESKLRAKFCMIPCNRIRESTITRILQKTEQQRPLQSYVYPNCIIVISNDIYFKKILSNLIHQKPRSVNPKN